MAGRASATFGVIATRRDGFTGGWEKHRKLASIGGGVRRWLSLHSFALNVRNDSLPPFLTINFCGLAGVTMTSLEQETGTP